MGFEASGAGGLSKGQAIGVLMPNKAGLYYGSPNTGTSTSSALGVGTMRLSPLWVPRAVTIDRLAAEVTTVGDIGSRYRLGIYGEDGSGYPGTLILDAGTVNGDFLGLQEIAVSQALSPGLYWLAGVVQLVSTVSPAIRTHTGLAPNVGSASPNPGTTPMGYSHGGVTGALPGTFTSSVTSVGTTPRVLVRVTT